MAARRSKRCFSEPEQAHLLERVGVWRRDCLDVCARAPINGPIYAAAGRVMEAIDGLAEAVTGDRRHFHAKMHSASPGFAIAGREDGRRDP